MKFAAVAMVKNECDIIELFIKIEKKHSMIISFLLSIIDWKLLWKKNEWFIQPKC